MNDILSSAKYLHPYQISLRYRVASSVIERGNGREGRGGEEEDEGAMQGKEEDRQREKEREREREKDTDKVDEDSSSGMAVLKKISTIASSFMQVAHYSDLPTYWFIYLFVNFEDTPRFASILAVISRVSLFFSRLVQADIVYARGRGRMGRSQHPMDACRAAVLSAGGIVTAAALTCITEMELQVQHDLIK